MDLDRGVDKGDTRRQRMLWVASMFSVGAAFLLLLDHCSVHLAILDRSLLFPSTSVFVQVPDPTCMMADIGLKAFSSSLSDALISHLPAIHSFAFFCCHVKDCIMHDIDSSK